MCMCMCGARAEGGQPSVTITAKGPMGRRGASGGSTGQKGELAEQGKG